MAARWIVVACAAGLCDECEAFPSVTAARAAGWSGVEKDVDDTNTVLFWTHVGCCPGCAAERGRRPDLFAGLGG